MAFVTLREELQQSSVVALGPCTPSLLRDVHLHLLFDESQVGGDEAEVGEAGLDQEGGDVGRLVGSEATSRRSR